MIVCSADRPPELRQWGAGQTIDQVQIYGSNVRWFYDLPVADNVDPSQAQNIAVRAWDRSVTVEVQYISIGPFVSLWNLCLIL